MAEFNVWSYLAKMGTSVKGPASRSLAEGDQQAGMTRPTFLTLEDIEEYLHTDYGEFSCQAPGCREVFSQLHESELHYNAVHRHACSVCRKSLPSPHLLELHIQEAHDSFFAVVSDRKPSYQCFLPTCPHVSWTPEVRHEHVVQEHKFPPDFRFDEVKKKVKPSSNNSNNGSKTNGKVKHKKKSQEVNGNDVEHNESNGTALRRPLSLARLGEHFKDHQKEEDDGMEVDVANNRRLSVGKDKSEKVIQNVQSSTTPVNSETKTPGSAKKSKIPVRSNSCRVPKNLSFGAGIPRGFIKPKPKSRGRHWHQASCEDVSMDTATNIETSDLSQLRDTLPM